MADDTTTPDLTKDQPAAPADAAHLAPTAKPADAAILEAPAVESHSLGNLVKFDVPAGRSGPVVTVSRASLSLRPGTDPHPAFAVTPYGHAAAMLGVYLDAVEDEYVVLGVVNPHDTDMTVAALVLVP